MPGVDREEKVIVLALYCSLGSLAMKLLMMAVLAVPGPPTNSVACTAAARESQSHFSSMPQWQFCLVVVG